MGRPLRADGRQTRQAILDAALALFAQKGYFGTSLRDIARAVGVRESALYNYFSGKDALFSALIIAEREHKAEQLSGLLESPIADARSVLERLATLTIDRFCAPRQRQLFRVLMSDGMRLAKEGRLNHLLERMTSGAAPLRDLMRRLVAAGFLRPAAPELLEAEFMGPLLLWRHLHALGATNPLLTDRQAFVRSHVEQFLLGATPRPRPEQLDRAPRTRAAVASLSARPRPGRSTRGAV
jgi:AcrR family transcriptional regulator